uniref:Uncharacterized protein n=1 Tax=Salix viminalis TaxID=40686 RepID=A0A6N2N0H9_SALVM
MRLNRVERWPIWSLVALPSDTAFTQALFCSDIGQKSAHRNTKFDQLLTVKSRQTAYILSSYLKIIGFNPDQTSAFTATGFVHPMQTSIVTSPDIEQSRYSHQKEEQARYSYQKEVASIRMEVETEFFFFQFRSKHTDLTKGCWNTHPRIGILCTKTDSVGQKPLWKTSIRIFNRM